MPSYRLYFLNSAGSIRQAAELPCQNDEEAIAHAVRRCDGQAMELWDRDRVVEVFPAAERALAGGLATKSEQRGAGEG
mgnify:CR=1 FL=1